jgi:hypothetical protein
VAWDAGDFGFSGPVTLGIFCTAATGSGVTTAKLSDFKVQMIGSDKGTVAATVKTDGGDLPPYPAWVSVTDDSGKEIGGSPTTIDGQSFVVNLPPGNYQVAAGKEFYQSSPPENITVKAGQETPVSLTIKAYPSISLGSDTSPTSVSDVSKDGWISKTDQDPANPISWYDLSPAQPDYVTDSSWTAQDVPGNLNPPASTLYWYRLNFKIPDDWVTNYSDKDFGVGNFNMDDSDRTFLNGTDIGERWGDCCRPRWYAASQDLLNANGDNTLAIQALQLGGGVGFSNDPRYYAGSSAQQIPTLFVSDPTNTITGVVKDASGQPVPDVPMEIWGSGIWGKISSQATTDANGAYKFYGIPRGSYSVVRVAQENLFPDGSDVQQVETTEGRNTVTQNFSVKVRPSVWLIQENGFNWLSDDNSAGEDHSAVDDPDTNFVPLEISKAKGNWSQLDDYGSGGWLRLRVKFPDSWKSELGSADMRLWNFNFANTDVTYFNGTQIGETDDAFLSQRDYLIDKSLVNTTGDNVIDIKGSGGAPGGFAIWRPILTLMATPTATTIQGDLNGDGAVGVQDATLSLRIAVGLILPTGNQTVAGDVNGDGKLTVQDTTLILRKAVGLIESF